MFNSEIHVSFIKKICNGKRTGEIQVVQNAQQNRRNIFSKKLVQILKAFKATISFSTKLIQILKLSKRQSPS